MYGLNLPRRWRMRNIPGPRPLWLLGNVLQMSGRFMPDVISDWAAKHGPVFRFFMGQRPVIVITGATADHCDADLSTVCIGTDRVNADLTDDAAGQGGHKAVIAVAHNCHLVIVC